MNRAQGVDVVDDEPFTTEPDADDPSALAAALAAECDSGVDGGSFAEREL